MSSLRESSFFPVDGEESEQSSGPKRSRRNTGIQAPVHPVETGRYCLLSPMVMECINTVVDCIEYRGTGFPIVGPQRLGKTRLIRAAMRFLAKSKPWLPVVRLVAGHSLGNSKREFLSNVLSQLYYAFGRTNRTEALLETCAQLLVRKAHSKGADCVVLFVDDAQKLTNHQYLWLCDIFNWVDLFGITLITFLVGEPQLADYASAFEKGEHRQILGRFFNGCVRFRGIASTREMHACLTAFDEARFPDDGPTFTQEYFSDAFLNGFRLGSLSDNLWRGFAAVAGVPPNGELEIPMQYFCNLVRRILKGLGPSAGAEPYITGAVIENLILLTGFRNYHP
jgi:hypothetical protein